MDRRSDPNCTENYLAQWPHCWWWWLFSIRPPKIEMLMENFKHVEWVTIQYDRYFRMAASFFARSICNFCVQLQKTPEAPANKQSLCVDFRSKCTWCSENKTKKKQLNKDEKKTSKEIKASKNMSWKFDWERSKKCRNFSKFASAMSLSEQRISSFLSFFFSFFDPLVHQLLECHSPCSGLWYSKIQSLSMAYQIHDEMA